VKVIIEDTETEAGTSASDESDFGSGDIGIDDNQAASSSKEASYWKDKSRKITEKLIADGKMLVKELEEDALELFKTQNLCKIHRDDHRDYNEQWAYTYTSEQSTNTFCHTCPPRNLESSFGITVWILIGAH
jgi:hypothetical protein